MSITHIRLSIPGPKPGPDPLAETRTARAVLLRLVEHGGTALEQFIRQAGPRAAAEQLYTGEIPEALAEHVTRGQVWAAAAGAAADVETGSRCGARLLIPEDDQWPTTTALSGTVGLWVRGQADLAVLSAEMVCVTGARAASSYGTHVAADLAGGLAARGYAVVAGASFGIEAAAHRGALAGRGTTVAVLSCGIDRAYPVAHENLLERIAQTGLLVSAEPPGATTSRRRVIARNRLQAALADATVVVEAGARSGALHTAEAARGFGAAVMAVPGPATSVLSAGPHQLLRQGATLVTSGADVVDALGLEP